MDLLMRIVRPNMWLMLRKYDPEVDRLVHTGIVMNMIKRTVYDAKSDSSSDFMYRLGMGSMSIWVGNYPYAYGYVAEDEVRSGRNGRPSIKTIIALRKVELALKENE